MRRILITIVGTFLCAIGLLLVIVPGPAWLLIPIGLAVLSTEYHWAKRWLKTSQAWMRDSARKMDSAVKRYRLRLRRSRS